jgi:hypothetical protein
VNGWGAMGGSCRRGARCVAALCGGYQFGPTAVCEVEEEEREKKKKRKEKK